MKSYLALFVLVAFAAAVMADDDEEKRFFWPKDECSSDDECPGQCCTGLVHKKCKDFAQEGERCSSFVGCGCAAGLECKFAFSHYGKKCVASEGSGSD